MQGVCENNIATERLWLYFYTIIGQSALQTSELVRRCSLACARVIYTRGSVYFSIISSYVLHHIAEYVRERGTGEEITGRPCSEMAFVGKILS